MPASPFILGQEAYQGLQESNAAEDRRNRLLLIKEELRMKQRQEQMQEREMASKESLLAAQSRWGTSPDGGIMVHTDKIEPEAPAVAQVAPAAPVLAPVAPTSSRTALQVQSPTGEVLYQEGVMPTGIIPPRMPREEIVAEPAPVEVPAPAAPVMTTGATWPSGAPMEVVQPAASPPPAPAVTAPAAPVAAPTPSPAATQVYMPLPPNTLTELPASLEPADGVWATPEGRAYSGQRITKELAEIDQIVAKAAAGTANPDEIAIAIEHVDRRGSEYSRMGLLDPAARADLIRARAKLEYFHSRAVDQMDPLLTIAEQRAYNKPAGTRRSEVGGLAPITRTRTATPRRTAAEQAQEDYDKRIAAAMLQGMTEEQARTQYKSEFDAAHARAVRPSTGGRRSGGGGSRTTTNEDKFTRPQRENALVKTAEAQYDWDQLISMYKDPQVDETKRAAALSGIRKAQALNRAHNQNYARLGKDYIINMWGL